MRIIRRFIKYNFRIWFDRFQSLFQHRRILRPSTLGRPRWKHYVGFTVIKRKTRVLNAPNVLRLDWCYSIRLFAGLVVCFLQDRPFFYVLTCRVLTRRSIYSLKRLSRPVFVGDTRVWRLRNTRARFRYAPRSSACRKTSYITSDIILNAIFETVTVSVNWISMHVFVDWEWKMFDYCLELDW